MEVKQMTVDEIKSGYEKGDLEVINGVLNGSVVPAQKVEEPIEQAEPIVEQPTEESIQTNEPEPVELDEYQRQQRYAKLIEDREREKQEELKEQLRSREKELEDKKRVQEELEKKLRELNEKNATQPKVELPEPIISDGDEEFESEYNKASRKKIEELRLKLESNSSNPEILEVKRQLEQMIQKDKDREEQNQKEKKRQKEERLNQQRREQGLLEVADFQRRNPEYQLDRSYEDAEKEYQRFRADIAYIAKPKTYKELEDAIKDYNANGKIKQHADLNGIRQMEDYGKFENILNLIDYKNGLTLDPLTGEYKEIKNTDGARVTYRDLDEAHKISNFYGEVNKAKLSAYNDVKKKLDQNNNAAVTLDDQQTTSFEGGISRDTVKEVFAQDPREWSNDPEKKKIAEKVYGMYNIPLPKIPGR